MKQICPSHSFIPPPKKWHLKRFTQETPDLNGLNRSAFSASMSWIFLSYVYLTSMVLKIFDMGDVSCTVKIREHLCCCCISSSPVSMMTWLTLPFTTGEVWTSSSVSVMLVGRSQRSNSALVTVSNFASSIKLRLRQDVPCWNENQRQACQTIPLRKNTDYMFSSGKGPACRCFRKLLNSFFSVTQQGKNQRGLRKSPNHSEFLEQFASVSWNVREERELGIIIFLQETVLRARCNQRTETWCIMFC